MVTRDFIIDPDTIDFDNVVADIEQIRKYNPQRFEMEQLTAIVHEDPVRVACVGYKDVTDQEFWVRGHMPGMPLMPGIVMLEAVAQSGKDLRRVSLRSNALPRRPARMAL